MSPVFEIERQRSNGDWTPVGQIDSASVSYPYPEELLTAWLEGNPTYAEKGRYRLIGNSYGVRAMDELLVGERSEWVVEKVKHEPEPEVVAVASSTERTEPNA